jgi:Ribbon-helix-helix protein, copG family
MVKVTFTFDDETVATLRRAAARLAKPQSAVVREAIRDYARRVGKLSEEERQRLLEIFDTMLPRIPARPAAETDAELKELRAARRRGGRRHPAE